jgi:hypothetical protein
MLIRATGEHAWTKKFHSLKVTVDGTPVRDVLEADDEAGYVIHYRRGADGKLVANQDRYETDRREGKVEFIGERLPAGPERRARAKGGVA